MPNTATKLILADCDGVLLNWNEAFSAWMVENGYTLYDENEYSIGKRYRLGSDEAGHELVRLFNSSPAIGTLRPCDGALHYVGKLHAEHGFSFTVVTCLSDNPNAAVYRTKNLKDVFGDIFEEIICLPLVDNKIGALGRWKDSGLFWIEDNISNAHSGYQLGLKTILLNRAYNAASDLPFPRVTNWKEIYGMITSNRHPAIAL